MLRPTQPSPPISGTRGRAAKLVRSLQTFGAIPMIRQTDMTKPAHATSENGGEEFIQSALGRLGLVDANQHLAAARRRRADGVRMLKLHERTQGADAARPGSHPESTEAFNDAAHHVTQARAAVQANLARPE